MQIQNQGHYIPTTNQKSRLGYHPYSCDRVSTWLHQWWTRGLCCRKSHQWISTPSLAHTLKTEQTPSLSPILPPPSLFPQIHMPIAMWETRESFAWFNKCCALFWGEKRWCVLSCLVYMHVVFALLLTPLIIWMTLLFFKWLDITHVNTALTHTTTQKKTSKFSQVSLRYIYTTLTHTTTFKTVNLARFCFVVFTIFICDYSIHHHFETL